MSLVPVFCRGIDAPVSCIREALVVVFFTHQPIELPFLPADIVILLHFLLREFHCPPKISEDTLNMVMGTVFARSCWGVVEHHFENVVRYYRRSRSFRWRLYHETSDNLSEHEFRVRPHGTRPNTLRDPPKIDKYHRILNLFLPLLRHKVVFFAR